MLRQEPHDITHLVAQVPTQLHVVTGLDRTGAWGTSGTSGVSVTSDT
jgi:hypothetical protein